MLVRPPYAMWGTLVSISGNEKFPSMKGKGLLAGGRPGELSIRVVDWVKRILIQVSKTRLVE